MKIQEFLGDIDPTMPSFGGFPLKDVNPLGRSQKVRWISDPNNAMRIVHGRLITYLRHLRIDLSSATGARKNCSPVKNVERHRYHRYFYLTDIHSAYTSVDGRRLSEILFTLSLQSPWTREHRLAETPDEVYGFLVRYCLTKKGGLHIGGPASPDLFNIYCAALIDERMRNLCARHDITFTRYLDDLSFSSDEVIGLRKRKAINRIVREAGFSLSDRKTKILDIMKTSIEINGIGLGHGGRIFMPRHYERKLRGIFHATARTKLTDAAIAQINGTMSVFWSIYRTPGVGMRTKGEIQIANAHLRFKKRVRSLTTLERVNMSLG